MKNRIYNIFKKSGVEIDKDVYTYGFNILLNYSIFLIVTIPLSILLNVFWEVVIFIISYIPLRRYVGGFHFDKTYLCLFFSIFLPILFSVLSNYIKIPNILFLICTYFIVIWVTYRIGVIDHPNKRISVKEKITYKRKALNIEIIYLCLEIICYYNHLMKITNMVLITTLFSIFGILITQYKHK